MNAKQLTKEQLGAIARRNAKRPAKSQVVEDVYSLMEHIAFLEQEITNKYLKYEAILPDGTLGVTIVDEEGLSHICGECGADLQIARPGKYQCPKCEKRMYEIENKGTATR